jgi:ATP-dependent DNA helicase RecQ
VGDRFRNGESVEPLQQSYNVQRDMILHHLATFVQAGQALPVDRLQAASILTPEQQTTVLAHFAELGAERLRPIFEAMAGEVNYAKIHLLRAVYCSQNTTAAPKGFPG